MRSQNLESFVFLLVWVCTWTFGSDRVAFSIKFSATYVAQECTELHV